MGKFCVNGGRHYNLAIKLREEINGANENYVIERSGVGNEHRSLQAELAVSFAVAREIFEGIFEFHVMRGQKSVDLHGCLEAKQAAQLGGRDFAGAEGVENESFEDGAWEVRARGGEGG